MAGGSTAVGSSYGNVSGFIFIFNLVVGTGALTLPKAMEGAGWLLALVFLFIVGSFAFISATFMVEAQAAANAVLKHKRQSDVVPQTGSVQTDDRVTDQLLPPSEDKAISTYTINERVEMTAMAEILGETATNNEFDNKKAGKRARNWCTLFLIIYLYGDLAVYCAAIPSALTKLATIEHLKIGSLVIAGSDASYKLYLVAFSLVVGPLCFFNFQKTAWLQYGTCFVRNSSFFIMVGIMLYRINEPGGGIPANQQQNRTSWISKPVEMSGFPELYGVCVYSFMCHHSLPSIISPIKNKESLTKLFLLDYIAIMLAYVLLGISALAAFGGLPADEAVGCPPKSVTPSDVICPIQELITENFEGYSWQPMAYYLSLYPVLALSSSFPLICITLRNNLMAVLPEVVPVCRKLKQWHYTLIAAIPPMVLAFFWTTPDVLAGVTGGYAGIFVQLAIPAMLVIYARRWEHIILEDAGRNIHKSPFKDPRWPVVVIVWGGICLVANTVFHILSAV